MQVADILRVKSTHVETIDSAATLREFVRVLAAKNVGALVVSSDGTTIDGILSERDIVHSLATGKTDLDSDLVGSLMIKDVHTCTSAAGIDEVMTLMTDKRIRHVPVVKGQSLVGLVSIGDIVNARLKEVETEREQLAGYISGS